MTPPAATGGLTSVEVARADLERIRALQGRISGMQRTQVDTPRIATDPAMADLIPGGALTPGAAYSVAGSTGLLMALLAGPSGAGAWCSVVGVPGFGVEAAAAYGVDLQRLVLVPDPGTQWLAVTAALADAVSVVAVCPAERVSAADAARLGARLRQRETVLLVLGEWPRSEARLTLTGSAWSGVGDGHGYPVSRRLSVTVTERSDAARSRIVQLLLPAADGKAAPLEAPASPLKDRPATESEAPRLLEAV